MKSLFASGATVVDRVLCVIGATLFAQAPEFMQQYLQRLGGHLAEARRQLAQFEEIARQAGKTVHQLAEQYAANPDPSVVSMGKVVGDSELRVATLSAAEAALRDASVWTRPFVFLRDLDGEIARGTSSVYKAAVPTTIEGLAYAVAGIIVILVIYHGLVLPAARKVFGRAKKPAAQPAGAR